MSLASGVGLVSGIDFNELIAKLQQVNARPINQLQNQKQGVIIERTALQSVNRVLLDFKEKTEALSSPDAFRKMSATSSDTSQITASASQSASPGQYSVKVLQLAQAARRAAQGVESIDSTSIAATDGSFSFKLGNGTLQTVDVTSGMTLRQLRDSINNLEGAGVRASVINDGTATNPHRLVLTSEETGSANDLKIITNDTSLNFSTTTVEAAVAQDGNQFDGTVTSSGAYAGTSTRNVIVEITSAGAVGAAGFRVSLDGGITWTEDDAFTTGTSPVDVTGEAAEGIEVAFSAGTSDFAMGDRFTIDAFAPELQQAQNALISVDGIQISRAGNEFQDVIEGVTLTARQVSEEPAAISLSNQKAAISGAVKEFVDSFNALTEEIQRQTKYDVESQEAAPLFGDSGVTSLLSRMRAALTRQVQGLNGAQTLSSVGVTFGNGGKLSLDIAKLNEALDADVESVMRLFAESGEAGSSSVEFFSAENGTQAGSYAVNITQAATQASFTGATTLGPGGLAATETLSFIYGESSFNVTLNAGSTLSSIIQKLNEVFEDSAPGLQAADDNGSLKIHSVEYGSLESFTISSSQAAGTANQLGIGTASTEVAGLDVAGTIDGVFAKGEGQFLSASSSSSAVGLKLKITAIGALNTTFQFSRGVGDLLQRELMSVTDSESGLFAVRNEGFDARVDNYDDRIQQLTDRLNRQEENLRAKFTRLEQKLSTLQSQGNFLQSQLAALI